MASYLKGFLSQYPATSFKKLEVKNISVRATTLFHQGALKLAEQGSPLNLLDQIATGNVGRSINYFFAFHPMLQHLHSDSYEKENQMGSLFIAGWDFPVTEILPYSWPVHLSLSRCQGGISRGRVHIGSNAA